ncbi:MAG: MFS transporter [Bdellovibrionaceae bacterium]|nr:MFS transporter [Pseudobdellovibrionaceae bacterium]
MIVVRDLVKDYGDRRAIHSLNFSVEKGEIVGFLGPNGAGKSTTMKIITGFMAPTSGEVLVAGDDVFENPIKVKSRIGYLPELPPVYGDMRVGDYLKFVAELKNLSNIKSAIGEALDKTSLHEVEGRLIQNLSKGFRQRVGIAQALLGNPEILILDEPTVGLDPKQVSEVRRLIQSLRGHHTMILSTHILTEVQATCEKVIIINQGKIVAQDTLSGLSTKMVKQERVVNLSYRRGSDLQQKLTSQNFVKTVVPMGDHLLQVTVEDSDDAIEGLARVVVESGAGLLELTSEKYSLEDIFIELTQSGGLS